VRAPATALYAFCRVADDAIDEATDVAAATRDLAMRLDAIYQGRPQAHEADRAFAAVVRCFQIPRALPEALLDGFLWDAQGRRYETMADVLDYAARVAGTVGAMMALIMGAQGPSALARACELGLAMQLTNIARDVGEDARMGRLYLPREWLREADIDPDAWLTNPRFSPALGSVVARLLATADGLYERAAAGLVELPRDCRPAIESARSVYREIGRVVEEEGLDSVDQRAVVSGSRKLLLVARSIGGAADRGLAGCAPGADALDRLSGRGGRRRSAMTSCPPSRSTSARFGSSRCSSGPAAGGPCPLLTCVVRLPTPSGAARQRRRGIRQEHRLHDRRHQSRHVQGLVHRHHALSKQIRSHHRSDIEGRVLQRVLEFGGGPSPLRMDLPIRQPVRGRADRGGASNGSDRSVPGEAQGQDPIVPAFWRTSYRTAALPSLRCARPVPFTGKAGRWARSPSLASR
jgi:phytoene synthase